MKITVSKSALMREANRLHWSENMPLSEAMRKAWIYARLLAAHEMGLVAKITFIKSDGSEREMSAAPARWGAHTCVGGVRNVPPCNYLVWDLEKQAFRQFRKSRLVSWKGIAEMGERENAA